MTTAQDIRTLPGQTLYDSEGDKVGEIADIYADRGTNEPQWLAVKTGLFGSKLTFVPLSEAVAVDDGAQVPYPKALIKDAPHAGDGEELPPEEEQRLYEHYTQDFGDFDYDRDYAPAPVGHDTSGPTTDHAMTRSEEEIRVGTTPVAAGRARLRKYVVTEQVATTVPVQREEVRIEREPITEGNVDAALDGPAISEEEHEVTLYEEVPVVEKRVVPKERVRLGKDTVTEEQQVSEEIRKERIEAQASRR